MSVIGDDLFEFIENNGIEETARQLEEESRVACLRALSRVTSICQNQGFVSLSESAERLKNAIKKQKSFFKEMLNCGDSRVFELLDLLEEIEEEVLVELGTQEVDIQMIVDKVADYLFAYRGLSGISWWHRISKNNSPREVASRAKLRLEDPK